MTADSLADLRSRPYEASAAQHADRRGGQAAALVYRRDIRRIALAAKTGMRYGHIVSLNLTFVARKGAELVTPAETNRA